MSTQDYQDWIRRVLVPMSFRSLTDTPGSFDGVKAKTVVVNDTETGLVFSDISLKDHSARHEEGAPDEVTGIIGKLNSHKTRHEDGGADKISVAGLSGVLVDKQDPQNHGSRHEDGGGDQINISNLPDYSETTASLGGDFDADQNVKCVKIGNMVCITSVGVLLHADQGEVVSVTGAIPSTYRPSNEIHNLIWMSSAWVKQVEIETDGTLHIHQRDWGGNWKAASTTGAFSASFNL